MLRSSSLHDAGIRKRTSAIVEEVRRDGDAALLRLTRKFDGAELDADALRVSRRELESCPGIPAGDTLRRARDNIERYSLKARPEDWWMDNNHGARVGEKWDALHRVGIYIPGGSAPLLSTALMTVTLARVAGCKEIAACTPCDSRGEVRHELLRVLDWSGATEIHRIGGAQAIAAMALGTGSIARVDKIFGPGNAYVVAAKQLLFGEVAIDLLPGPSEVLVLADASARPDWVAADLVAQAEHGSGHERVVLIATESGFRDRVLTAIEAQLPRLPRGGSIRQVIERNGWFLHVDDLDLAIDITNRFAPEHCQIMAGDARSISRRIRTAGALLLGHHSPAVLGDYVAGPSHVLPTGGAGRAFSGLMVHQFMRRTSMVQYDADSLGEALPTVASLARMEGLEGHGRSAAIRLD